MLNQSEGLRLAHCSDLHYSPGNLAEADRCFGFAVEHAIEAGCHLAVVSGDSTDYGLDAHTPAFGALARRIHRLSGHCPILMLQGTYSHEPPGTLDVFRLIGARHPVYVADRIQQVALCDGEFHPSEGPIFSEAEFDVLLAQHGMPTVVFTCVPTVNKAVLASAVGVAKAATAIGDHLAAYLTAAGNMNRRLRNRGVRTVGVSHGTVNGCETEHGVPMAGFDHEFSIGALFDAECDAFLLGHIHRAQQWAREGRVVAYPGSIGRFHYGEIGAKGYLQWEITPGHASASLVETPARETVCVDFDGPPDMNRLAEIAAQASDKFVRVRWTVNEEHRQLVDRDAIVALFGTSADLKLEARVVPAVRSRAEGISRAATLPDKLSRWGELTGVDARPLVDRLAMLDALDAQSIADGVLEQLRAAPSEMSLSPVHVPVQLEPATTQSPFTLLEDDAVVTVAHDVADARPDSPTPAAADKLPMDWLTDDLFA